MPLLTAEELKQKYEQDNRAFKNVSSDAIQVSMDFEIGLTIRFNPPLAVRLGEGADYNNCTLMSWGSALYKYFTVPADEESIRKISQGRQELEDLNKKYGSFQAYLMGVPEGKKKNRYQLFCDHQREVFSPRAEQQFKDYLKAANIFYALGLDLDALEKPVEIREEKAPEKPEEEKKEENIIGEPVREEPKEENNKEENNLEEPLPEKTEEEKNIEEPVKEDQKDGDQKEQENKNDKELDQQKDGELINGQAPVQEEIPAENDNLINDPYADRDGLPAPNAKTCTEIWLSELRNGQPMNKNRVIDIFAARLAVGSELEKVNTRNKDLSKQAFYEARDRRSFL